MRRWYVWIPITIGLFVLLLRQTRPWDAAALASRLDWTPLIIAILLNAVIILGWAIRSRWLMAAVGSPMGTAPLIPVVTFANTVNNMTPASSGEVLRAMILHRRHAVPYASSTAVILSERLWGMGIMLVTAAAASVGTVFPAPPWLIVLAWIAAIAASFGPSIVYALGLRPGRAAAHYAAGGGPHPSRPRKVAGHIATVDERLSVVLTRPAAAIAFVASTAMIFVGFAAQLWLVLVALEDPIGIVGVWAAYGLAIVAGRLSSLPFGLGATDVVLVVLLQAQGVDPATAGAAALLLRLVDTLPLGIVGLLSWIYLNRTEESSVAAAAERAAAAAALGGPGPADGSAAGGARAAGDGDAAIRPTPDVHGSSVVGATAAAAADETG